MQGFPLFRLGGIPVHISMWYVFLMGYIVLMSGATVGLMWAGVVTLSILMHEFGHAVVALRLGLNPSVLLHGWGGLTSHRPAERDRHDVAILVAGPGAGLLLGALTWIAFEILIAVDPQAFYQAPLLVLFRDYMLYVNLLWSLVNLVPLWPLDGGQLFRIGLKQKASEETTHRVTHGLGAVLGIGAALVGLALFQSFFLTIVAGMLAYTNIARLSAGPQALRGIRQKPNLHAEDIYERALGAMQQQDWAEAVRLGHQMRSENLTSAQLERVWELLAVATTNKGDYEEALRYVERAPDTPPVQQAKTRCLDALGHRPGIDPVH